MQLWFSDIPELSLSWVAQIVLMTSCTNQLPFFWRSQSRPATQDIPACSGFHSCSGFSVRAPYFKAITLIPMQTTEYKKNIPTVSKKDVRFSRCIHVTLPLSAGPAVATLWDLQVMYQDCSKAESHMFRRREGRRTLGADANNSPGDSYTGQRHTCSCVPQRPWKRRPWIPAHSVQGWIRIQIICGLFAVPALLSALQQSQCWSPWATQEQHFWYTEQVS